MEEELYSARTTSYFFFECQVGVAEMKAAVERTGGLVVLSESYGHSVFKDSFKRAFEDGEQSLGLCSKWATSRALHLLAISFLCLQFYERHLFFTQDRIYLVMIFFTFIFSGTLQINCSKDIKVQGIIGPCASSQKVWPTRALKLKCGFFHVMNDRWLNETSHASLWKFAERP